ncbi:hypothetical protein [Lentzea aerocolonigenes]|uniref:hypothetical protein n=1 Tax=Lentzea aerocolonigenes TaxID=68170 RepID=UPI000AFB1D57|nr:hypothetical protein [Lentzea aerocolonigenes]MCP2245836.1 hypothetical protein [Lentzea aerocolonigenes]
MRREPNRSRSRRIVFVVAVLLAVVATGSKEECGPPRTTGTLATLSLLPRLMGVLGRGLWLISVSSGSITRSCPD